MVRVWVAGKTVTHRPYEQALEIRAQGKSGKVEQKKKQKKS